MRSLENKLSILIQKAKDFGARDEDLKNASEFLEHREYGLCFDTLIVQMYEYEIKIDSDMFALISEIGSGIGASVDSFSFMKELIR